MLSSDDISKEKKEAAKILLKVFRQHKALSEKKIANIIWATGTNGARVFPLFDEILRRNEIPGLHPTGHLLNRLISPIGGELSSGSMFLGVNQDKLSGVSPENFYLAHGYAHLDTLYSNDLDEKKFIDKLVLDIREYLAENHGKDRFQHLLIKILQLRQLDEERYQRDFVENDHIGLPWIALDDHIAIENDNVNRKNDKLLKELKQARSNLERAIKEGPSVRLTLKDLRKALNDPMPMIFSANARVFRDGGCGMQGERVHIGCLPLGVAGVDLILTDNQAHQVQMIDWLRKSNIQGVMVLTFDAIPVLHDAENAIRSKISANQERLKKLKVPLKQSMSMQDLCDHWDLTKGPEEQLAFLDRFFDFFKDKKMPAYGEANQSSILNHVLGYGGSCRNPRFRDAVDKLISKMENEDVLTRRSRSGYTAYEQLKFDSLSYAEDDLSKKWVERHMGYIENLQKQKAFSKSGGYRR